MGVKFRRKKPKAKDKPTETTFLVPRDHASAIAAKTIEDVTWVKNMLCCYFGGNIKLVYVLGGNHANVSKVKKLLINSDAENSLETLKELGNLVGSRWNLARIVETWHVRMGVFKF